MLNEMNEVNRLIDGNLHKNEGIYRACLLLTKYYKHINKTPLEARLEIIKWMRKNNIAIDFELNALIDKIYKSNIPFIDNIKISISKKEMQDIFDRFDNETVRYTAFLILCIAKLKSNKYQVFDISLSGLSHWGNIGYSNLKQKILKELMFFSYIELINKDHVKNKLIDITKNQHKSFSKANTYKLLVDMYDEVDFIIEDDLDMRIKYEEIKNTIYDIKDSVQ